ncbi:MAG: hypothetical protein F6K31_23995 [Symploca sp. SIO2G7]|nr:hypothetical protein [Symploca sp. SIO2G7]
MSRNPAIREQSSYRLDRISRSEKTKLYPSVPLTLSQESSYFRNFTVIQGSPFQAWDVSVKQGIQELVQALKLENICRVRVVAPKSPDLHILDFELELQPGTELSSEAWDKIQDLVIDYEWKLRDETNEKWYFHAKDVEVFSQLKEGSEVIAEYPIQW